jgi:hypothetical protein
MSRPGPLRTHLYLCFLALFSCVLNLHSQVIYDNTGTRLGSMAVERREYGDQVDLGGTARRLTQILFEYYAQFTPTGDEEVKVRLYSNETVYDNFRKAPTTLLYESPWSPITPGYNTRLIDGLNVLLPLTSVTFTVEFRGIAETEQAGMPFFDPPSEGYSFNEFWARTATGGWASINYSNTDSTKRANLGLRLIAVPNVIIDQQQNTFTATVPMLEGTNCIRLAQTFTADTNGLLNQIVLNLNSITTPVRLRILDTIGGRPGPNVLATRNILSAGGTNQSISLVTSRLMLEKGKQYVIELSTSAESIASPTYLLAVGANNYSRGALWFRPESGGLWTEVTNRVTGSKDLDATFQVHIVPAQPAAEILSPRPFESFDLGEPIVLRARHKTPEIGSITRMRFMRGTQEIASIANAPYEFIWTNAPAGDHNLRAIADDSFRRPFRSDIFTITVRPAGAPDNDLFARRVPLDGLNLRRIKPSASATTEPGEPGLRLNNPTGATLWWTWTAYDATPVTLSAQNSSAPGASIAVFTGTNLTSLNPVAQGLPSVHFTPQPGVTYAISADPAVRGDQVVLDIATADIRIDSLSTNVLRVDQPLAVSFTGSSLRKITNVNLYAGADFFANSRTAPGRATNIIRSNGFFDLIAVGWDDRGIETYSAPVRVTVRPGNDSFAESRLLRGNQFATSFSPAAATLEPGEPNLVDVGYTQRGSTWFVWTAPVSGPVRMQITSSGSAAAIGVFTGTNLNNLALVKQNAGTGIVSFDAQAGTTYRIRVIGNATESSPINLSSSMGVVQFTSSTLSNGTATLTFDSANRSLTLEYSADLITWKRASVFPASTQPITWSDPGPPATDAPGQARFYRLVAP